MRDLVLALIVFGTIPFIFRNPFIGLLTWVWLGIMNPHKLSWGWASDLPFAQIVAICMLLSVLLHSKKLYSFPKDRASITLIFFVLWLGVSPLFSFHPEQEFERWLQPTKIIFMTLMALVIVGNRDQLHKLVGALALSVGFFGIKGGLFTLASGGSYRVWGPPGGAISDNNSLAVALVMTVPLFRYLQLHTDNKWIRRAALAAMALCAISAIGSQSRGAFLAMAAIGTFLWTKSRQKGLIGLLVVAALPVAWLLMPESWSERMSTIQTYDTDASAMGRINAWHTAWNLAVDRFPIGAGFAFDNADVFARYAPNPANILVAHSIYFQILGQHGFFGLALFLMVFGFTWLNFGWVAQNTKAKAGMEWAHDLSSMSQVTLTGYAVGGAFLNLAFFDLPYYLVVISVILRGLVRSELRDVESREKLIGKNAATPISNG